MFKSILRPDLYHGKTPWNQFEGWYFKLVDKNAKEVFCFIPGVFWGKSKKEAHSFIQVLEGSKVNYSYHQFSSDDFIPQQKPFQVKIQQNIFSLKGIKLHLDTPEQKIKGLITFKKLERWPDGFLAPGSMGYFNLIPFMQCYSQVCVMGMSLMGTLTINGIRYCLDEGTGYIEKNWGNAFPYSWIWIQSNHFANSRASLSCSIGHIPFWFTSFRGFLVGLYHNDQFYEFTTMNHSKIRIISRGEDVEISLKNKAHTLLILTEAPRDSFILCKGPRDGKMIPLVQESLRSRVSVRLIENTTGNVIMDDIGTATGIEYGGEQMKILD